MRNTFHNFSRTLHGLHIPTLFNPGSIRSRLRDKYNRALAATTNFLRSLRSEPAGIQVGSQKRTSFSPNPVVLPTPHLPLPSARKNSPSKRLQKILGHKLKFDFLDDDADEKEVVQCTPVRDLRPFLKMRGCMAPKLDLTSKGISKRYGRNKKSMTPQEGLSMRDYPRASAWGYSRDELCLPPSVVRKQLALQRLKERRRREIKKLQENGFVTRGKTLEDRKVDWKKYEQDRSMDQPICVKRRSREELIEVILAEPEIKIRRIDDELDLKLEREGRSDYP